MHAPLEIAKQLQNQVLMALQQHQLINARAACSQLLSQFPNSPHAIEMVAVIASYENDPEKAVSLFDVLATHYPNEPNVHWNLARVLLASGQFERGWQENEWRHGLLVAPRFPTPHWKGEPIANRRILLHAEGGFGDTFNFCRYVPLVAKLGAEVMVECQPQVRSLLARLPGVTATFVPGEDLPPFDVHCPFLSLPLAMGTTLSTIPANVPYLIATPEKTAKWAHLLGQRKMPRVGISWAGSPQPIDVRSHALSIFAPLAGIRNVEFHSLQKGPQASEFRPPGLQVIDHSHQLEDFE